ncbi:dephospho-CoA kinase [Elusimicrobium simillimum]|uniref:dephospho-CoA kinase n=1 Tax=Elusimicrobium simillimum TaxID=3143438 RepID=UPI003C6EB1D0
MTAKIKIGLTGTILSGKSTALKIFEALGAYTMSSDAIVHELQSRPAVQKQIFKIFKTTDKAEIAAQAFTTPAKRKKLEALLHPMVMREASRLVKLTDKKIIVLEAPVLFEGGVEKYFDIILCMAADEKTLEKRIKSRGMTKKDFAARSAAQLSGAKKMSRADIVVYNNGTVKDLEVKIKRLYKILKK